MIAEPMIAWDREHAIHASIVEAACTSFRFWRRQSTCIGVSPTCDCNVICDADLVACTSVTSVTSSQSRQGDWRVRKVRAVPSDSSSLSTADTEDLWLVCMEKTQAQLSQQNCAESRRRRLGPVSSTGFSTAAGAAGIFPPGYGGLSSRQLS